MGEALGEDEEMLAYAVATADSSYEWYRSHAIRSRRLFRSTELSLLLVSASIPIASSIGPLRDTIPSLLGALVFTLVGLRSVFHWQENYLRFSQAREAVEAERRLFKTKSRPYDRDNRGQVLVRAVTRIEQQEMGTWISTVSAQPTVLGDGGNAPLSTGLPRSGRQ